MKIVFFGNSKYSVIDAKALHEKFGLSAIVTLPDRTKKGKNPEESPVKIYAKTKKIPVIETKKITPDIVKKIQDYKPDFLVVADYGLILPKTLLSLPTYAPLNVHHSLLPKYRGPAPAPAAILQGDKEAGVSIITMTEKIDAGDILAQVPYTLTPNETTDSLLSTLNTLGSHAVISVIEDFLSKKTQPKKQNESRASYTAYMTKEDSLIKLSDDSELNWRKIRAYGAWPGTYFLINHRGKEIKVKIKKARFEDGVLIFDRVIPENKREMAYEDFLRGLKP